MISIIFNFKKKEKKRKKNLMAASFSKKSNQIN